MLALFALALIWLATALGLAAKSVETASNTPMFLTLLPFLGSGFVPTATMPAGLRQFAEYQPFTPVTETLRGLLTGTPDRRPRRRRRRHGASASRSSRIPGRCVSTPDDSRGRPTRKRPPMSVSPHDSRAYRGVVSDDAWAALAARFADEAYATVKGYVRTYVMHQHLLEHLPDAPAPVLDVGGGAGHQSFPLAEAGYEVTLLDPSPAMLDKARQRLGGLSAEAQRRVTFVQADGEHAAEAVGGRRYAAVLCHGVLGYLDQPEPLVNALCTCAAAGGVVSIMTANANAMAVQPALERRWDDALAAFDARSGIGVLGVQGRADTVEEISQLLQSRGVEPVRWYGVWLFVDWLEFSGAELDPGDAQQVAATAAVELEASRRDPYRQLSRVFHLIGRKSQS